MIGDFVGVTEKVRIAHTGAPITGLPVGPVTSPEIVPVEALPGIGVCAHKTPANAATAAKRRFIRPPELQYFELVVRVSLAELSLDVKITILTISLKHGAIF